MHVTRPKSAKGRSRPTLSCTQSVDPVSCHRGPLAPRPPSTALDRANGAVRPPSTARQGAGEIPELLQQVLVPPVSSLNRYRVLPSIEKREPDQTGAGLEDKMTQLSLSDDLLVKSRHRRGEQARPPSWRRRAASQSTPDRGRSPAPRPPRSPDPRAPAQPGREAGLLLAVRSPSGTRFQHLFRPSDTLQTVLAAAEAQYGTSYRHGVIETMEVPRRSFPDLSRTLEQCGIQNKSVLCIGQEPDEPLDSTFGPK
ncbi:UBX domain-containing protein 10 [Amia ocellicauda]|uniref:UBX domain-containing protein 10 n=1 Tax=Amia ocellicauda TaxID=2972642 RepID=UPI003464E8C5